MSQRNSLKAHLLVLILPRNVQHVRFDLTFNLFETCQVVAICVYRFSLNPGLGRQDSHPFRLDRLYRRKSNVGL